MKRIVCEMCGGNDLIKQDGLFVCQNCGTKYSVEEARKLMAEGTVRIDNSESISNNLINARKAKDIGDWSTAARFYNLVKQDRPDSYEADFYSAFSEAQITLPEADYMKRDHAFSVLMKRIEYLDKSYDPEKHEENEKLFPSMATDIGKMLVSGFTYHTIREEQGFVIRTTTDQYKTYTLFFGIMANFKEAVDRIVKTNKKPFLYKAIMIMSDYAQECPWVGVDTEKVHSLARKWKQDAEKNYDTLKAEEYWDAHADEKAKLEAERSNLNSQLEELRAEIARKTDEFNKVREAIPENEELAGLDRKIKELMDEKSSLGLFKGKEKKAIQEKIDALTLERNPVQAKVDDARDKIRTEEKAAKAVIQREINLRQGRIEEIDQELTRKR